MKVQGNIPAHPTIWDERHNPEFNTDRGMTLLDHFAGLAMQDIMDKCGTTPFDATETEHDSLQLNIAVYSYAQAEAMLKARQQYL